MKRYTVPVAGLVCALLAGAVSAQTLTVRSSTQVAVSAPLRDGNDDSQGNEQKVHGHPPVPKHGNGGGHDDALQTTVGGLTDATTHARFPGVGANGSAPPDPSMAVGPNHILQTVNTRYAIFTKGGALQAGPFSLGSIWKNLGGGCASNFGDPIAQYDKLADRFIVTQLGSFSSPFLECIAVSTSPDPTGTYYLYSFSYGNNLNDYTKVGVWPTATNSAYLVTHNLFANGASFIGSDLCAYDRTAMLSGAASPTQICFTISNDGGYLPSDLDGSTAPGIPGQFATFETLSSLRRYSLNPNFSNPSASTLTWLGDTAVASFSEACGGGRCIPQSGTSQLLDSLGDRLMYRLAYRNFVDHQAMVVNHSVTAGSSVGVRWYELRAPASSSAFSLYQQGTYAPDATYRWMGSAAMDQAGDIAIGYSASSLSIHPGIRWAGRVPGDPLGTLGGEVTMLSGAGSQTGGLSRWGDYTAMRIDPSDDCTFWYTNEYEPSDGSFNWATFFGSFKFASCGAPPAPDFSISASPTSLTLTQGNGGSSTMTVTSLSGFSSSVALTVASGCPAFTTCVLSPTSVTPPTNGSTTSTLTVTTNVGGTTPAGTTSVVISGNAGVHTTSVSLTVNAPPPPTPDFTISASPTPPSALTISRNSSGHYTVNITQVTGSSAVNLSVSNLPNRTSASFSPNPAGSPGSSTLTISVRRNASTVTGRTLTITGNNGSKTHSTTVTLNIN